MIETDIGSARDDKEQPCPSTPSTSTSSGSGDHPEEWFAGRGPLANAVVEEIKAAGAYVFAGGLVEDREQDAFSADATSGSLVFTDGPFAETKEYLGGITVVDVPDREAARYWAGRIAEACGWPQEVRTVM